MYVHFQQVVYDRSSHSMCVCKVSEPAELLRLEIEKVCFQSYLNNVCRVGWYT